MRGESADRITLVVPGRAVFQRRPGASPSV
jgi:hypothetical protein